MFEQHLLFGQFSSDALKKFIFVNKISGTNVLERTWFKKVEIA